MIYTILLVIIVILSLSLAVSVFVLFTTLKGLNTNTQPGDQFVQKDSGPPKSVPTEQMVEFDIYGADEFFRLAEEEGKSDAVLLARIKLRCDQGNKNKNAETVNGLYTAYKSEIEEVIRMYVNELQPSVASKNDMTIKIKQDLKEKINEIFDQGKKEKQYIVVDVILSKWFVQ